MLEKAWDHPDNTCFMWEEVSKQHSILNGSFPTDKCSLTGIPRYYPARSPMRHAGPAPTDRWNTPIRVALCLLSLLPGYLGVACLYLPMPSRSRT